MSDGELEDPLNVDLASVGISTRAALSYAESYVKLMEEQISKAHADEHEQGLAEYYRIANADEVDYHCLVRVIDENFEDNYKPILRYTSVIYLYILFETYTKLHIAEIQGLRGAQTEVL